MTLFYRKDNCHAGLFPRNGELFARKVIVGSLCGRVALNGGKIALGARDIHLVERVNLAEYLEKGVVK